MHIPDGLIAPQVYLGAAAIAVPIWVYGLRRLARSLDHRLVPRLAVLTALAFVLSTVMIPLPGGSSAHLIGIGLLVVACGFWAAFVAYSLVLLLQAVLFGAGGITALPINALCIGLVGGGLIAALHALMRPRQNDRRRESISILVPVWLGIVVSSALVAVVLGIQPMLGQDANGQPLYFPFGIAVTLPVVVVPHLLIGLFEGLLSVAVLASLPARRLAT